MQVAREHNIKTKAEKSRGAGKRNSTKMQKSGTQTISRNSHTVQLAELRSNATIVRQTGGFLGDAHCTLHTQWESKRTRAHYMQWQTQRKQDSNNAIRIRLYSINARFWESSLWNFTVPERVLMSFFMSATDIGTHTARTLSAVWKLSTIIVNEFCRRHHHQQRAHAHTHSFQFDYEFLSYNHTAHI